MKYSLGKLPARRDAVKFKFMRYADPSALPTPPLIFGQHRLIPEWTWQMFGNDNYGDCVWAGAAHETISWNRSRGHTVSFSDKAVLSDYSAATGFNPRDPNTDNGTDMQAAASYRRKKGIVDAKGKRHKIEAYVALDAGDWDQLMLACYLFGAVGVGIQFPRFAGDQFDHYEPWDTQNTKTAIDGGHYIPALLRNSKGSALIITWGRNQAMTKAFYQKYSDEAVVYLSKEMFDGDHVSREGFDIAKLRHDMKAL